MRRIALASFAAAVLLCAGVIAGLWLASRHAEPGPGQTSATPLREGKAPLYYHDPMHPEQKFDKPGKSPFMNMDLVPVYDTGEAGAGGVAISPRMQQSLGVRTAEVRSGRMVPVLEAVGSVAFNERDVAVLQARSNGFVERLLVRAPLDPVRKGQVLAELYVPDWVAAQEEYLTLRRTHGPGLDELTGAARQRMVQAGMSEAQVRQIETSGAIQPRAAIIAPIGGVVAELGVREGMSVGSGATMFRINGLGTVWVNAEIPESQAALVHVGGDVDARSASLPGSVSKGRVAALLPEINPATRTLKARIELANPGMALVPGMFVSIRFAAAPGREVLQVPTESVIATGRRNVVIVQGDGGRFTPVEVETGLEADGQTEIRQGLKEGMTVVVSGQFLIDSEASLSAAVNRMSDTGPHSDSATPKP